MSDANVNKLESIGSSVLVKISTCKAGQVASKLLGVIFVRSSAGKLIMGKFTV